MLAPGCSDPWPAVTSTGLVATGGIANIAVVTRAVTGVGGKFDWRPIQHPADRCRSLPGLQKAKFSSPLHCIKTHTISGSEPSN
jgi:hypothetical protein